MSESNGVEWSQLVEQYNEAVADSIEQNVEAQAAFVESWADAMEQNVPEEDVLSEGVQGLSRAYEVWMDAAEDVMERAAAAAEGEDVDPSELRDVWLQSANQAFKEVMSTSAFASANGQLVTTLLEAQREVDEANQDTLAQLGFATRDDVEEVGERLVELERRQQAVEEQLEQIHDAVTE
ncbi:MAG: poly(R)-hydroxyalkanoic acid synthase subunit PhaE [Salinirussus sp.]